MRLSRIVHVRRSRNDVQIWHIILDLRLGISPWDVNIVGALLGIVPAGPGGVVFDDLKLGGLPVALFFGQIPVGDVVVTRDRMDPARYLGFRPFGGYPRNRISVGWQMGQAV